MSFDELEGIVAESGEVTDEVEASELAAALNRFLAGIGTREQICFVRRYYFSESVAQIVEKTGFSKSTVYELLAGIRVKLQAALKKEGFL